MLSCWILDYVAHKTHLKNIGYDYVDGINLVQDTNKWLAGVDLVSDLQVAWPTGPLSDAEEQLYFLLKVPRWSSALPEIPHVAKAHKTLRNFTWCKFQYLA